MNANWTHPKLGSFSFDQTAWVARVEMPAFKSFKFDPGFENAGRSTGVHELAFVADDQNDTPTAEAVALAEKVLENQKPLVAVIAKALWADFEGEGPASGMWWHGDMDQVAEALAETIDVEEPPESAKELLKYLSVSGVTVRKNVSGMNGLIVEVGFHAGFEEEHGVGVLTDGQRIVGIGYSHDVKPFR